MPIRHQFCKICIFRRLYQGILLSFCCGLLLGPMSLLQLGAWSWMLFAYSHEAGLSTAIEDTFSGERPCRLCTMIEASAEESSAHTGPNVTFEREFKLLVLALQSASVSSPSGYRARYFEHDAKPCSQLQFVSLPPPKNWMLVLV